MAQRIACTHLPGEIAQAVSATCQECGSTFNLRVCVVCGHVGCCESQASHAREHALGTHHNVIKSLPVAEGHFTWCYECDKYV